jgi:hypothetical protein
MNNLDVLYEVAITKGRTLDDLERMLLIVMPALGNFSSETWVAKIFRHGRFPWTLD